MLSATHRKSATVDYTAMRDWVFFEHIFDIHQLKWFYPVLIKFILDKACVMFKSLFDDGYVYLKVVPQYSCTA